MSVICALHLKGRGTWLGSDSLCVAGGFRDPQPVQKWFLPPDEKAALGCVGELRAALLLGRDQSIASKLMSNPEMAGDAIRSILKDDGFVFEEGSGSPWTESLSFILATAHAVYSIDPIFCCTGQSNPTVFCAEGSGLRFAYGAWHALKDKDLPPEEIVRTAVGAACKYNIYCGGEIFVHRLEP